MPGGTDLKSIPLPLIANQERPSHKMSAKEILEKALKEHKSSRKDPVKKNVAFADPVNKNVNSQRIVDELFKDFISKKIAKPSSDISSKEETGKTIKENSSISEMSKLLDMEISSIQAQTKDAPVASVATQNAEKSSTEIQKLQSKRVDIHVPLSSKKKTEIQSDPPTKLPASSLSKISSPLDDSKQIEARLTQSVDQNQDSHEEIDTNKSEETSCPPATQEIRAVPNLSIVPKKGNGPKQLGCKLSIQSLNLIQSTDRIDRKGRVWEDGEVLSSQSEESDQAEEASDSEHNISETGSIGSQDADSKHHSSKHKKKHKHKHKKKKKKSSKSSKDKEKSKHKRQDSDRKKEGNRDKTKDKHDKSSKEDTGNERTSDDTYSTKERDEARRGDKHRKRKHSRSPTHHRKSRSKSRSRSRSPKKSRKDSSPKSAQSFFNEWDARCYGDNPSSKSEKDDSHSKSSKRKSSHKRRRSGEDDKDDKDLRVRIDKAKLRKIAIANALNNLKSGQGPQPDLAAVKAGGRSVEELTDFCKRISEKDRDNNNDISDSSDEEPAPKSDDDELPIHHPFKVRDTSASNIIMNIRNAKQLPILTPSEKQAQQATLRLAYPVSSGSHHRASESEWVPVEKTRTITPTPISKAVNSQAAIEPPKKEESKTVFPDVKEAQNIDIGSIISERLQAVRKLQENPYDVQALSNMHKAQEKASRWASSKHLPGQYVGSTGARVLSQEELIGDKRNQAWAKKIVPADVGNRLHRVKCIPVH